MNATHGYTSLGEISSRLRSVSYRLIVVFRSANKMPAAVREAIQRALVSEGRMSEEDAKEYVVRMEKEGRLIEECWS